MLLMWLHNFGRSEVDHSKGQPLVQRGDLAILNLQRQAHTNLVVDETGECNEP